MAKSKRGGKREGAGRPKGTLEQGTLDKLAAREFVRAQVTAALQPMVAAQISNAMGIRFLVVRQKSTGKFKRRVGATDEKTHDPDTEIIEVWEKDPSVQAFTDLVNRAIDKPKEQEIEVKLTGDEGRIARLLAGRKRAKDRKGE